MRLKIGFGIFVLLLINSVCAFAQTLPCGGDDPDAACPLDTWVTVLAIALAGLAVFRLYRQKTQSIRTV